MTKVSDMYDDLPIKINDAEYEISAGRVIGEEISATSDAMIQKLLDDAHQAVYYDLIYAVGGKELKDRLISANMGTLARPIKMCLIMQIDYMIDAGGNYAGADLSSQSPDGNVTVVSNDRTREKIVAPGIAVLLQNTKPNLLMGMNTGRTN